MTTQAASKKRTTRTRLRATPQQAVSGKGRKAKAEPAKSDRPEQLVITMSEDLKRAVQEKAKRAGVPMTVVTRILLESWVGSDVVRAVNAGRV